MRFILASNNKNKLRKISEILAPLGAQLLSQGEAGLDVEAEETGDTFEENALIKAEAAVRALGLPAIADDSGLEVMALEGAPGVRSARYGGEACRSDTDRLELLLRNMEGKTDRRARFVSQVVCVFPNGDRLSARGECYGTIAPAPRGQGGFGYDPIFLLPSGKTMAELTPEEKNALSHRGRALEIFEKKLRDYYADRQTEGLS